MPRDFPPIVEAALTLTPQGAEPSPVAFGGLPRLPKDVDWPRCREGVPLHFMAEIDFETLPRQHEEAGQIFKLVRFPETGTLLIFASMDDYKFTTTPSFAFIHVQEGIAGNEERTPPDDIIAIDPEDCHAYDEGGLSECGTYLLKEYCKAETFLSFRAENPLFRNMDRAELGNEALRERDMAHAKQLEALGIVDGVSEGDDGTPICNFGDRDRPKRLEQMFGNGYLLQNAAEVNREKVLLLQLEKVSGIDLNWMIGGITQCWIEAEDLAAGRFEKAFMTFECG